jgi:integrase/recombinase XerD
MSSINILLKGNYISKKTGKSKVILRIIIDRVKHELTVKDIDIEERFWDSKKQRIKSSHPDHEDLNMIINMDFLRANEILRKYRLSNAELTWKLFYSEWKNPSECYDFLKWMENEINERFMQGLIETPTRIKHLNLIKKLSKLRPLIQFSELDESLLNDFKKYMIQIGNSKNTQGKDLVNLKIYTSIAFRRKLINHNPFIGFKIPKEEIEPFFITRDDRDSLLNLYEKNYLEPKFQKTLRAFLFICYTGLRPSDFLSLTMEQIEEIDGIKLLSIKMQKKTERPVHIPLSSMALKLIKDECPHRLKGKIFNTPSEQKMNDYIKFICRLAGIEESRIKEISLKTGRHTFATLALKQSKSGAGLLQVAKLLGHKSTRSTEIYLHVLTGELEELIDKI